ncbi:MAG: branched-chain amino acid ABC transporter permease [Gammaproteobacteria bacterium]|nr:branched-chain amino acid ABC transporter permease [Gammaproteobacteria bacterium]
MIFDEFVQSLLVFTGINIIAAFSFYVPFKTGQVSLGQAGFMGVGAYAAGIMTVKFGLPYPVGLLFGGVFAGFIGVCVGFPALRIRGIYLLLLTLGFAQIVQVIALTWEYTGAHDGFQGIPYQEHTIFYVYGVIILLLIFFSRLERSSLGRAMVSIHEDEEAAEVMGIDVVRTKLFAFGVGALIAGLAGAMFAHYLTYVDSRTFNILLGVEILMFAVVGGVTTYWGPILGACFLTLLPEGLRELRDLLELIPLAVTDALPYGNNVYDWLYEFLNFENEKRLIAYGLILIGMMIVRPQGLLTRRTVQRLAFWRRGAASV